MRRALLALAAAGALAAPASAAAAEDFSISMPGKYFDPQRLTVVAGDEVQWRNADLVAHEVRATGGAFDSGTLGPEAVYAHRFDTAGSYPLICTLHPFMTGAIDVVGATLDGPHSAVAGETVTLTGRAAADSAHIALEQRGPDGAWSPTDQTTPGADGAFAFRLTARETGTYRAVATAGTSPALTISVSEHLGLAVRVHRGRVTVRTMPRQKGLVATLQRYSRERFMWRRIAHATTDRRGLAEFRLGAKRGTVRVLLSRTPGGAAIGTSAAVRLHDGRRVADPGAHAMD